MYISAFHIDGFGVYSNVNVENLPAGLTIFLGGNEAGKSTCLEFLRVMLTGEKKRAWKKFAPLRGGQPGGAITAQCQGDNGRDEEIRICRRPGAAGLSIRAADGRALGEDVLLRLLRGVNAEVYRRVFGFSLGELERFESLSADEVRNALYGASFGSGLVSPGEVLSVLCREKDKIFRNNSTKPVLNSDLAEYEAIRSKIAELVTTSGTYDDLALELEAKKEERDRLRQEKGSLENERRQLEKRMGAWRKWEQWNLLGERLAALPAPVNSFPENAEARLAASREAMDAAARQLSSSQLRLQRLRETRESLSADENILAALPELRRLAERKNSYRQALGQLSGQAENCSRAKQDLEHGLAQLGPGWDCDRIRTTDRSLFARQDLEKQAREMQGAIAAHNSAIDYLGRINDEAANCESEVSRAGGVLNAIPQAEALLTENERDELRQNMSRLEESRRLEPGRERALNAAQNAFNRAFEQTGIERPEKSENGPSEYAEAKKRLDDVMGKQDAGLKLAEEMRGRLEQAAEVSASIHQVEINAENIKRRIDEIRSRQRANQGPQRDILESRTVALRNLRSAVTNIATEKERLEELDGRINGIEPPVRVGSWVLLVFGIVFLLLSLAIFAAHWLWALTEINLGSDLVVPINVWAGYGALVCGVAFMAGAFPGNGPEQKRRARELAQLQNRRETCAMHLAELNAQANQHCETIGVDSMDAITLDATEMLLEREKEQCFHEERSRQEIQALNAEMAREHSKRSELQETARSREGEAQQCRMRWHSLMQSLHVKDIPSPEGAGTFFAKVEAARLAYENVANAQRELDALWEDLHLLEESISNLPPVAQRLENSQEALSLESAARLTLEACRDADQIREKRVAAQNELQTLHKEFERIRKRQEEAAKQLHETEAAEKASRDAWSACLDNFGLGSGLDPETVREAFKFMENCLSAEERHLRAQREMAQSRAEIDALRAPLEEIAQNHADAIARDSDGNPDWLATLDTLLAKSEQAAAAQKEKERLEGEIQNAEEELALEERGFADARLKIESLLKEAGAANENEFLKLAREYGERAEIEKRLADLEMDLKTDAAGESVEDFLATFKASSEQEEEGRLAGIGRRLDAIRDRENELVNGIGVISGKMESFSSTSSLPGLRQDEAMLKESMRRKAIKWSGYAMAHAILSRAKSIFEKERQPEVIKNASEIFAKITDGRWAGISASLEDKNLAIIAPDGSAIAPENLSRGAQEQAYLALRLAYIRNHAERAMPLPVIMDEILVNFDPERAARSAEVICDLARGLPGKAQQIIYFTCQPFMAEIFKKAAPDTPIYNVRDGSITLGDS